MRLRNVRSARLAVAVLAAACAGCSPPAPAAGQDLAARARAEPDGVLRFSYSTRQGVCGTGGGGIRFRDPRRAHVAMTFSARGGEGEPGESGECLPGPLYVALTLRSGEPTAVGARIGAPPSAPEGTVTDAGTVQPAEAARYLLAVAERGGEAADDALRVAVLAADEAIGPELLRIARARALPGDTRGTAVLWAAILGDRATVRELHGIAGDAGADETLRGHTVFAIGQTQEPEDAAFLRDLYARLRDDGLKDKVIFSLSQMKGVDTDRWLLARASDRGESVRLREQAVFWLAETGAPLAGLDSLYQRLDDRSLREQVIFAYFRREGADARQRLLELARSEPDGELRGKAIFWVGQLAGNEATRELTALARDERGNREMQEQAVFALSQRSRDEGVPALIQIARGHRDPEIRRKALFWLGQSGDPRALDLFAEILGGH